MAEQIFYYILLGGTVSVCILYIYNYVYIIYIYNYISTILYIYIYTLYIYNYVYIYFLYTYTVYIYYITIVIGFTQVTSQPLSRLNAPQSMLQTAFRALARRSVHRLGTTLGSPHGTSVIIIVGFV